MFVAVCTAAQAQSQSGSQSGSQAEVTTKSQANSLSGSQSGSQSKVASLAEVTTQSHASSKSGTQSQSVSQIESGSGSQPLIALSPAEIYKTCGFSSACYSSPDGCSGEDCDFVVAWQPGDNYTDFAVSAKIDQSLGDNQYVSIGMSPTGSMPGASCMDCIYYNGKFYVWSSYNQGYDNVIMDNPLDGLDAEYSVGAVVNDHFSCNFRRIQDAGEDSLVLDLNAPNEYHLIIAQGKADSPNEKEYHVTRMSSASELSFADCPLIGLDPVAIYQTCGEASGCYSTPDGCTGQDCDFLVAWQASEGYTDFAVSAKIDTSLGDNQYVSIGMNPTGLMPDASVMDCIVYDGEFSIWASYNQGYNNVLMDNPLEALEPYYSSGSVIDDHLTCNYRRVNHVASDSLTVDLAYPNQYYLIIAQGKTDSPTEKEYHKTRLSSGSEIAFYEATTEEGTSNDVYYKAHAILMTLAWGFLAGFGLINARYYKDEFKGKTTCGLAVWFANHRHSMVLATLLTVAGFIVIYWRVGGYVSVSVEPAIVAAHPPIGVTVTVLAVVNPIMAIFRGGKDAWQRWYFNWAHLIVGESAFLLGYMNILLGMKHPSSGTIATALDFWLIVAFGLMHLTAEILLFFFCKPNADNEEKRTLKEDAEGGYSNKGLSGKVMLLGVYSVVGLIIVLVVCTRMEMS